MQIGKHTTLDKLGRITLLKDIRDLFMMKPGDELVFCSENGRVFIEKKFPDTEDSDQKRKAIEDRVRKYTETMRMLDGSAFEDDVEV